MIGIGEFEVRIYKEKVSICFMVWFVKGQQKKLYIQKYHLVQVYLCQQSLKKKLCGWCSDFDNCSSTTRSYVDKKVSINF